MNDHEVIQVDYEGLRSFVDRFPEENADVFDRLAFLWDDTARTETHFLVLSGGTKIVAVGSVKAPQSKPSELWLTHVSVDPAYKNQGNGKNILKSIFNYAAKSGKILSPSSFEPEGLKYLAPAMAQLHLQYPDLKIRYNGTYLGEIVNGYEPYKFVQPHGWGSIEIKKLSETEDPPEPKKKNKILGLLSKFSPNQSG